MQKWQDTCEESQAFKAEVEAIEQWWQSERQKHIKRYGHRIQHSILFVADILESIFRKLDCSPSQYWFQDRVSIKCSGPEAMEDPERTQ